MDEKRVYQKKIDVRPENIQSFYDKRARTVADREEAYTTVLLGDQNPQYARQWDAYEKSFILSKLRLDETKNVLDIGCGMGRWTKTVAPLCNQYYGLDFSEDMVRLAKEHFSQPPYDRCTFLHASLDEALQFGTLPEKFFDAVIIAGVSMYINDALLQFCYEHLPHVLRKGAILYIEESVAVKERLTLNHIWSEGLKDDYDAIYRTREEYQEIMTPLRQSCRVLEDDYMDALDKKEFSETSHWYTILEYGE